jgi:pilus assembly protein FimV
MTSTVTLGAGTLAAAAAVAASAPPDMESTMQMAAFPGGAAAPSDMAKTLSLAPVQTAAPTVDVDFDLGGAVTQPLAVTTSAPDFELDIGAAAPEADLGMSLDFDIGGPEPAAAATPAVTPATDFAPGGTLIMDAPQALSGDALDHSMDETQPLADVRPPELPSPTIDFDFDLGADSPSASGAAAPTAVAGNVMDFDLSGINLDLPVDGQAASGGEGPVDDAATKLDLAKAYQDMGDKEGARELLQEVLKEGSATQQAEAQNLLSALG